MRIILSIIFTFCFLTALSQQKITGRISDSVGNPLPFIPIGLLSLPDSMIIKGTMTDDAGNYSLEPVNPGNYVLIVSAVGYQKQRVENVTVDSSSSNVVFNIKLTSSAHTFNEVSVAAMKRTVEFINGNVKVNVEDSPLAQGNTVYDLITKLPGVSVENSDIKIQGKTGVVVMIDERPQRLSGTALINLLKSMNADLVKSIEVLKNPPVKYDANGTSGMINIISKKTNVNGETGTIFSSASQGFYGRILSGASFNYKSKKITFYSNFNGDYSNYRNAEEFKRNVHTDTSFMFMDNNLVTKMLEKEMNYKVGLDWMASPVDLIGLKIEGDLGKDVSTSAGSNFISGSNELGFDHMLSKNNVLDNWNSANIDFNFDHKLDTLGSYLTVVTDYTVLTEDMSNSLKNAFYNQEGSSILPPRNYLNSNESGSNVLSARADVTKQINGSSSLECGLKTVYAKTSNNYLVQMDNVGNDVYIKDEHLSNKFLYKETTYAGYFNYNKVIRKLTVKLGMRMEKTNLTINNFMQNFTLRKYYFNVFPNVSFEYKKNEANDFQLNLSRRIDRPGFYQLSPFIIFMDQYSYGYGNPFLLPDYANRAEFSYSYKGILTTSMAYSYVQNRILYYNVQDDTTKALIGKIKNIKSSAVFEYSVYYQKTLLKKLDMSVSGTFLSSNFKGDIDGLDFNRSGIEYFGNLSLQILVNKNTKLELEEIYKGPFYYGIAQGKSRWNTSVAIKFSLCKERLDLTLGVEDIFHTFYWRTNTNFDNQDWHYKRVDDTRRIKIAINYKFGRVKIEERNIDSSNEEEKGRLNH